MEKETQMPVGPGHLTKVSGSVWDGVGQSGECIAISS